MQPATLLTLLFCSLLLHTVLGLPLTRQTITKSAHDDDLISGTDFLSVFIGASIPRSGSVNRSRNFNKRIDSNTSEQSHVEQTTVFVPRTAPKDNNSLQGEALVESPSNQRGELQTESEEGAIDEVSTDFTIQADDNDAAQKSPLPNTPLNGVNAQIVEAEPIEASSNGNDYVPNFSSDKISDVKADMEKDEMNIFSTSPSNIPTSELEISTRQTDNSTTTEILSSETSESDRDRFDTSEVPIENKTLYTNPDSSKEGENEADWSILDATEEDTTENQTHKVVEVRVSSSVAQVTAQQNSKIDNDNKYVYDTFLDSFSHDEFHRSSPESASLVTEKEPAATAVQRSELSVEEALPSSSIISVHQEGSPSSVQTRQSTFDSSGSNKSPLDPQSSPVSYHTSVSTATSNSRVQFYREPPTYRRTGSSVAETVQRRVLAQQPKSQSYGQSTSVFQSAADSSPRLKSNYQSSSQEIVDVDRQTASQQSEGVTSRAQKSYTTHQEPPERNYEVPEEIYGTPERSYATPEKNYEVDEVASVMTNGRVHGVQFPAVTSSTEPALRELNSQQGQSHDPNSKFGYVVEGRNFRKYQVEERTPDGFIVGEYGVVSHDDGSLRGVRYTADGTINPRLIYDALAKFLSL